MQVILLHGLGRSRMAMALLAWRLRRAGLTPHLFGYLPLRDNFEHCLTRLAAFIAARTQGRPYLLAGHSMGTVLIRGVLPRLAHQPAGCFLLAPPTRACRWATRLAARWPYRLLTRDMGQKLADEDFMARLPVPQAPTRIFAGTFGPRWRWWPAGAEENDGILMVSETALAGVPRQTLPASHTYIMNRPEVAAAIIAAAKGKA